jgi:hypothetical protein
MTPGDSSYSPAGALLGSPSALRGAIFGMVTPGTLLRFAVPGGHHPGPAPSASARSFVYRPLAFLGTAALGLAWIGAAQLRATPAPVLRCAPGTHPCRAG